MPYLNSRGDVAHGKGDGYVSVTNTVVAKGGVIGWMDDTHVAFFNARDGYTASAYDTRTQAIARVIPEMPGNEGASGGGVVAWWFGPSPPDPARVGLYSTTGMRLPAAGVMGVGPDGSIAYKPDRAATGPTVLRHLDGSELTLTPGHAAGLCLLSGDRAIWEERSRPYVYGLQSPVVAPGVTGTYDALETPAGLWICCYSATQGILLHPWDSTVGYVVLPAGQDGWHTAGVLPDGSIRVAVSRTRQEQAGEVWIRDYTLAEPRVETCPAPPPPPLPTVTLTVDRTTVVVGEPVVATIQQTGCVDYRWMVDNVRQQPDDASPHTFLLGQGSHILYVKGVTAAPVVVVFSNTQTVTVEPKPVPPDPPPVPDRPAWWRLQTGEEIPESWAWDLEARTWTGVRVEHQDYTTILGQCHRHGFRPLWILRPDEEQGCPREIDVELGNEPDIGCSGNPPWPKMTSDAYAAWVLKAWPTLCAKGCTVYVGAISNPYPGTLNWLKAVLAQLPIHDRLRVSLHRYPDGDQDPTVPKKGYSSLAAENAAILATVAGRKWAVSEAGLTDYTWTTGFWFWKKSHTRLAVDSHRLQAQRFKALGVDFYVVYQLNDDPNPRNPQYGVRTVAGAWKATSTLPTL